MAKTYIIERERVCSYTGKNGSIFTMQTWAIVGTVSAARAGKALQLVATKLPGQRLRATLASSHANTQSAGGEQ